MSEDGRRQERELKRWIEDQGPFVNDLVTFTAALGRQLVAVGVPVVRLALNVQLLHPRHQARTVWWQAAGDRGGKVNWPRTVHETETFRASPMQEIIGEGRRVQYRLDSPAARHPIDSELRELGATEYFGVPLRGAVGLPHALSVAVDGPGLSPAQVRLLESIVGQVTWICDARTLMETARSVSILWEGRHRGRDDGEVLRGDAYRLFGVFVSLSWEDFVPQTQALAPREALRLLNRWHGIASRMVRRFEGEILGREGSRVLAFFNAASDRDSAAVCRKALDAVRSARAAAFDLTDLEADPPRTPEIRAAIDLREALGGPTGAEDRIDFTVAGDVHDLLAALLLVARAKQEPIVVSRRVAGQLHGGSRSIGQTATGAGEAFAVSADPEADTLL